MELGSFHGSSTCAPCVRLMRLTISMVSSPGRFRKRLCKRGWQYAAHIAGHTKRFQTFLLRAWRGEGEEIGVLSGVSGCRRERLGGTSGPFQLEHGQGVAIYGKGVGGYCLHGTYPRVRPPRKTVLRIVRWQILGPVLVTSKLEILLSFLLDRQCRTSFALWLATARSGSWLDGRIMRVSWSQKYTNRRTLLHCSTYLTLFRSRSMGT